MGRSPHGARLGVVLGLALTLARPASSTLPLDQVPERLRDTPFGRSLSRNVDARGARVGRAPSLPPPSPVPLVTTEYLEVPLNHTDPGGPRKQRLRFWVLDHGWSKKSDAPIIAIMPSEGAPPQHDHNTTTTRTCSPP